MNCSVEDDNVHLIPHVINPEDTASDVDVCFCLSEDKICMATLQMKNSKAPGSDHIFVELLMLGGDEQQESILRDWKGQIFVPLHIK